MEELGHFSYEEAKPYLKTRWAEQLAEMSEDKIKAQTQKFEKLSLILHRYSDRIEINEG